MIFGSGAGQLRRAVSFLLVMTVLVRVDAANETPNLRDTLVYKDGDRVQGKLVETTGDVIVFQSDRFGQLRVSASHAVVIKADKIDPPPTPRPALPPAVPPTPAQKKVQVVAEAEAQKEAERATIWDRFYPSVLTAQVRNFFGPWHGRLSFSAEVVSDIAERNNSSYEAHVKRKWKSDEVQMTLRYDYNETNELATTDLFKASGQWRHEFSKSFFGHYRPSGEWNRASRLRGVPNDYILLQQEVGFGYHLLTKPTRKLRLGVSHNLFDTWNTAPVREHSTQGVMSMFEEADITLPWRMTLSQRGVWYPGNDEPDGWENRIELIKKLTETLSTSVRHEIRRNNPDGSAQDYTRLKLLFGLDF